MPRDAAELTRAQHRAALKAAGLCVDCGKRPAVTRLCADCRESRRQASRRFRARRKAEGYCLGCGTRRAIPGQSQCERCRERHREYRLQRRNERIEAGACARCGGEKPQDRYRECPSCREVNRNWYHSSGRAVKLSALRAARRTAASHPRF